MLKFQLEDRHATEGRGSTEKRIAQLALREPGMPADGHLTSLNERFFSPILARAAGLNEQKEGSIRANVCSIQDFGASWINPLPTKHQNSTYYLSSEESQ